MILQMTKLENFFKLEFKELNNTKKADADLFSIRFFVAPLGLEPRHTEPESAVLPLHNRAVRFHFAKLQFIL